MNKINIWPINILQQKKYQKLEAQKRKQERFQKELKIIKDRLYCQEIRDSVYLHKKEPPKNTDLRLNLHVEENLDKDFQNIDTIFRDIIENKDYFNYFSNLPDVDEEIVQRNKSILMYFKDELKEEQYNLLQKQAEKMNFSAPCPCGTGKEFYRRHLK